MAVGCLEKYPPGICNEQPMRVFYAPLVPEPRKSKDTCDHPDDLLYLGRERRLGPVLAPIRPDPQRPDTGFDDSCRRESREATRWTPPSVLIDLITLDPPRPPMPEQGEHRVT